MSSPRPLPPEEDLFVRIALHNKLITGAQAEECVQCVLDEVLAGRVGPSLAAVFVEKGYMGARAAEAVRKAVTATLARRAAGRPGRKSKAKPSFKKAPAGDSQVAVSVSEAPKLQDKRFLVASPANGKAASLTVSCHRLAPADGVVLEAYLGRLIATGREVLNIDLRRVEGVPSLVIGVLVKSWMVARDSGQRVLLHCRPAVAKAVRLVAGRDLEIREGKPPAEGRLRR
jgi:hypothetical protein